LVGPPTAEFFAVTRHPIRAPLPRSQVLADKVFSALERFLHVEAVSGIVLLAAAASALLWANSPAADSYHHFWDAPLTLALGELSVTRSLHFVINDALMTVFFLVVGMEIRRELHEGALASVRLATLPLAAAIGGVLVPALFYIAVNGAAPVRDGWAIPTATDIAFAVGVLALLGKSISASIRIFLLALAIIDDIAAVIIIAIFYSGGLDVTGLIGAVAGIILVLVFQRVGIGAASAYVIPGAIIWFGLLKAGAHPTLAGIVLGLMTPVVAVRHRERPLDLAARALQEVDRKSEADEQDARALLEPVKQLRAAQRELIPPVVRVQSALHPWVAYGVMPLFALANAGVEIGGDMNFSSPVAGSVLLGVLIALVCGKPIGIMLGSWIAVRLGWCELPAGMTWRGVALIGCLGGIGFTMSIFIATLAFADEALLSAAKSGVLLASAIAAILGLVFGRMYVVNTQVQRQL
jgi:Na+:H+ antiporter, NhaA family